jgi:DNA-binding transcriptional LysR family regulator
MNRAALELNTVQSNVTARVKSLEDELGVPLFQRHARGVNLTPAGRRMLPFSARMVKLLSDAASAARDDGIPSGSLVVGTLETTAAVRLPGVLAEFARSFPKVRPTIRTGTTCGLIHDVIDCQLEGAFVAGPVDHPELEQTPVFREELVLVTPCAIKCIRDLAQISDLKTIVFRVGCSYRSRLEHVLARLGFVVSEPLEYGSLDAILGCVAAGVGITLLPRAVVTAAARAGHVAIHELAREYSEVETLFIRRRDSYVSSALTAFLQVALPQATTPIAADAALKPVASAEISRTSNPTLHSFVA